MARPEGFEPPTPGSEVPCSILLSYGRTILVAVKSLAQHPIPRNPLSYTFACRLLLRRRPKVI
jgi:hypothetical protein